MLSYCLKCKKILRVLIPKFLQLKSKFIKKQKAKGLLSNLDIRTPLSEIPLLGDVLF